MSRGRNDLSDVRRGVRDQHAVELALEMLAMVRHLTREMREMRADLAELRSSHELAPSVPRPLV